MLSKPERKLLDDTHKRNLKREHLKQLEEDFEMYSKAGYTNYAESIEREIKQVKSELNIR